MLGYTKNEEERHFSGVIPLEECTIEEASEEDAAPSKNKKDKKANGPDSGKGSGLAFKITNKVPYKTVLKAIDESNATCGKRLASINVDNTEVNRQAYRQLLLTTGLG
ncbi:hypothetical protein QQ045_028882 [Rhodiola kirilowii]